MNWKDILITAALSAAIGIGVVKLNNYKKSEIDRGDRYFNIEKQDWPFRRVIYTRSLERNEDVMSIKPTIGNHYYIWDTDLDDKVDKVKLRTDKGDYYLTPDNQSLWEFQDMWDELKAEYDLDLIIKREMRRFEE